jgi:hypothetical protein
MLLLKMLAVKLTLLMTFVALRFMLRQRVAYKAKAKGQGLKELIMLKKLSPTLH